MTSTSAEGGSTLVDVYAAAAYFRVAPMTVHSWVRRYGIKPRGKDGRRLLYALEELLDHTPGGR